MSANPKDDIDAVGVTPGPSEERPALLTDSDRTAKPRIDPNQNPKLRRALEKLSEGLGEGEDPLYYEWRKMSGSSRPADPPKVIVAGGVDVARAYVPATILPAATEHKTFEVDRVQLAAKVDPRKAQTMPSLRATATPRGATDGIDATAATRPSKSDNDEPSLGTFNSLQASSSSVVTAIPRSRFTFIGLALLAVFGSLLSVWALREHEASPFAQGMGSQALTLVRRANANLAAARATHSLTGSSEVRPTAVSRVDAPTTELGAARAAGNVPLESDKSARATAKKLANKAIPPSGSAPSSSPALLAAEVSDAPKPTSDLPYPKRP